MRSSLRTLALLVTAALPVLPAAAEEPTGTACGMYALFDADDAGLLVAYDGLRKGLELAQLPRVCRHDPDPQGGGVPGFLERQAAEAAVRREAGLQVEPLFALGDASIEPVLALQMAQPFVMAVARYTAARKPLRPLPDPARGAVVYADVAAEQVGHLLRSMLGREDVSAWFPATEAVTGPAAEAVAAFEGGAGCTLSSVQLALSENVEVGAGGRGPWPERVDVVLHVRLGPAAEGLRSFEQALEAARRLGVPLVTDDRARFGHGAVVVLVPRHDLLGRAAADEGRKLREDPTYAPRPRAVPGMEVWVDLEAADRQGLELPLPFIARADRLRTAPERGGR